jgi:hypothetical protein
MMRGVQVVLGYVSIGIHSYWSADEVTEFWELWTNGDESIWDSFRQAVTDNSYAVGGHNAEIAAVTGFSVGKLKTDLHRARAEMRRRLGLYLGQRAGTTRGNEL